MVTKEGLKTHPYGIKYKFKRKKNKLITYDGIM